MRRNPSDLFNMLQVFGGGSFSIRGIPALLSPGDNDMARTQEGHTPTRIVCKRNWSIYRDQRGRVLTNRHSVGVRAACTQRKDSKSRAGSSWSAGTSDKTPVDTWNCTSY